MAIYKIADTKLVWTGNLLLLSKISNVSLYVLTLTLLMYHIIYHWIVQMIQLIINAIFIYFVSDKINITYPNENVDFMLNTFIWNTAFRLKNCRSWIICKTILHFTFSVNFSHILCNVLQINHFNLSCCHNTFST